MELKIHAGQRVLYKHEGQWHVGEIAQAAAYVDKGLFIPVHPQETMYDNLDHIMVEINDLFLEAIPVEDWMSQYGYLMPKEEYIKFIQSDEFDKNIEHAYVSDGEYYYYNVNKYSEQWLRKQPFDYIVRGE